MRAPVNEPEAQGHFHPASDEDGAKHFFENKLEPQLITVGAYLGMRLVAAPDEG